MPNRREVVVLGGHGVFGSLIARELDAVALSRRDGVDARDLVSVTRAIAGRRVVVHAAGPFAGFDDTVLRACLETDCHYVDISDDRRYCACVAALGGEFESRGLTAAWGCSSLPGISGALAGGLDRPRVTLFIGNKNPKGAAAIASLVGGFGRERGMRDGVRVRLPGFGQRTVYNFPAPGPPAKVGFESRFGTRMLAAMSALGLRWTAPLRLFGRLSSFWGSSGGVVMVDAGARCGWVQAERDGQRMAALPAIYCVRQVLDGKARPGAWTAHELLGAENLLTRLEADGYGVRRA